MKAFGDATRVGAKQLLKSSSGGYSEHPAAKKFPQFKPRKIGHELDLWVMWEKFSPRLNHCLGEHVRLDEGAQRREPSTELRTESIGAHSTVLRALGGLGSELMKAEDWKDGLAGLRDIDWSKTNPDWQDVCIVANSVVSSRQVRAAMRAYLKRRLGMAGEGGISLAEEGSLILSRDTYLKSRRESGGP